MVDKVQEIVKSPVSDNEEVISGPEKDGVNDEVIDPNAQAGIQKIEAVTSVWTPAALVIAYILIWITYFVEGMLSGVQNALLPYVTSAFAEHSLTPTVLIVSTIVGGCTNFTIAKILDVFGRPPGYLLCIVIAATGLVMMAACREVEAFAAAQVFYTVGNTGLQYTLSVFVADTSKLRSRGLMTAATQSPNMITPWIAGPIATAFLHGAGWPWAFGMFAMLVPAVTLPLYGLLQYYFLRAKKQGVVPKREGGRTAWQSIVHHAREFDAIGLILLSAGAALFLLPFNLYSLQSKGWSSPLIICLLVFGVALLITFAAWEKYFAPISFIPYSILTDRTVIGACLLSGTLFFSYNCWFSYFSSFLQVVNGLSVTHASYVIQTYNVGTVLSSLAAGAVIHYTGRFKYLCFYGGIPLSAFGLGLMVYFRQPDEHVGYIVMCQIFISLAAGVVIITDEIAMLSAVSHQYIAVAIATLGFFGGIGGAVGLTVSSAIWQKVLPNKLAEYLPAAQLPDLLAIYADLDTQLSYPVGSPARTAIQHAYASAQKDLLITGTSVWALGFISVLLWRNVNVSEIKQVKGIVA